MLLIWIKNFLAIGVQKKFRYASKEKHQKQSTTLCRGRVHGFRVLALGGIEGGAGREKPPFTVVEKTGFLTEGRVVLELWNCGSGAVWGAEPLRSLMFERR